MSGKKILVLSGSRKKRGNTAQLIEWFRAGAKTNAIEIVNAADLRFKVFGCTSCRRCQQAQEYTCVIKDEASLVLKKMAGADAIVFATPLYFFAASAPIKAIMDRMFSLYKWDNEANTFTTPLRGKTLGLIASAYEDIGLEALAKPFQLTADYTGMKFKSLLVKNAGVSGELARNVRIKKRTAEFGRKLLAAILLAFSLTAAGAATAKPLDLAVNLTTDKTAYVSGQPVKITLTATNKNNSTVDLLFGSGQSFDLFVTGSHKQEVWRWSKGMVFTMAVRHVSLAPHKSLVFTAVWKPAKPGKYRVRGRLTSAKPQDSLAVPVVIK